MPLWWWECRTQVDASGADQACPSLLPIICTLSKQPWCSLWKPLMAFKQLSRNYFYYWLKVEQCIQYKIISVTISSTNLNQPICVISLISNPLLKLAPLTTSVSTFHLSPLNIKVIIYEHFSIFYDRFKQKIMKIYALWIVTIIILIIIMTIYIAPWHSLNKKLRRLTWY